MLTGKDLNTFQAFALLYWVYMDRRTHLEDVRGELEQQTFNLFPERWQRVYLKDTSDSGEDDGEVVDAVEDLDSYFDSLDETHWVSGADVSRTLSDEEGWY